jgi:hypothetical protein
MYLTSLDSVVVSFFASLTLKHYALLHEEFH